MRILVAQSGGPTAVINSSLVGVLKRAQELGHEVLGGLNGIEGILKSQIVSLNFSDDELNKIAHRPGAFLGSCRYKLPPRGEEYDLLFDVIEKNHVDAFLYIGGNDSMDAVMKLHAESVRRNIDLLVNGIPKTVDNDLVETDHCPGYLSAAKFLNTIASEFVIDSISYSSFPICVMETMGRDTGWLAASLKYSEKLVNGLKVLVYIPEIPTSLDEILEEADQRKSQPLLVVVSEGVKKANGEYLKSDEEVDAFGHPKLGGVGEYVASALKKVKKTKFLNPGFSQRSASHCTSELDFKEADMVGAKAVDICEEGKSGLFMGIKRLEKNYLSTISPTSVEKVANKVKYLPREFSENDFELFLDYISPMLKELTPFISWRG